MESQELKKFAQEVIAAWKESRERQLRYRTVTKPQAQREVEFIGYLENALNTVLLDRYKKSPQYAIDQAEWEEGAAERAEYQEKLNKAVTDAINKKLGTSQLPSKIIVI